LLLCRNSQAATECVPRLLSIFVDLRLEHLFQKNKQTNAHFKFQLYSVDKCVIPIILSEVATTLGIK